jgi:hypothetical protein
MVNSILGSLREAWGDIAAIIGAMAPRVIAALLLVVVGWGIAKAMSWAARRLAASIKVDRFVERTPLADALRFAELPTAGRLAAVAVFWLVWIAFLAAAVDVVQLPGFERARLELVAFVGRLVRASVVAFLGVFIANIVWRASLLAAFNAGWPSARLLATLLRGVVLAVTLLTALAELGIPLVIVLTAFSIAFGALMLGLALAFGLGGRDAAREMIARHDRPDPGARDHGQPHL